MPTDEEKGLGHAARDPSEHAEQKVDALAKPDVAKEEHHLGIGRDLQLAPALGGVTFRHGLAPVGQDHDLLGRDPARQQVVHHALAMDRQQRSVLGQGAVEVGGRASWPVA